MPEVGRKFICEFVARPARARAHGISGLNHKARYHAVKNNAVIKPFLRQFHKIRHGFGRLFFKQLRLNRALGGFNRNFHNALLCFDLSLFLRGAGGKCQYKKCQNNFFHGDPSRVRVLLCI